MQTSNLYNLTKNQLQPLRKVDSAAILVYNGKPHLRYSVAIYSVKPEWIWSKINTHMLGGNLYKLTENRPHPLRTMDSAAIFVYNGKPYLTYSVAIKSVKPE